MSNFFKEVYYVAWGDIRFLRHTWINVLIMSLMTPLLYLVAFGYGLRTGETDSGFSYIAFVIPGIVALTALSAPFSATSTRLNVQRLYYKCFDEMMMCPLSMSSIMVGKSIVGVVRGLFSCLALFLLGLFLAPDLTFTPLFLVCLIISCFVFSFLGVVAALMAKSHQSMATFSSVVILPMTFLCGTFFSVSSLPTFFQVLLYCLPLTHASECIRAASLGTAFPWWSLAALIAFGIAFYLIGWRLLKTKKI